jgi:hypothetical protein
LIVSPGEYPPDFAAADKTLDLRDAPYLSARVSQRVNVSPNQRLEIDDVRYRTVRAGRIRVLKDTAIHGRLIGSVRHLSREQYYTGQFEDVDVPVKRGAVFEYLQYRAEGTCFIRIENRAIDAGCPADIESDYKVEIEPQTEWWIHVVLPKAAGWVLVVDRNVKRVYRQE